MIALRARVAAHADQTHKPSSNQPWARAFTLLFFGAAHARRSVSGSSGRPAGWSAVASGAIAVKSGAFV